MTGVGTAPAPTFSTEDHDGHQRER
jgi:hypothetical protein